MSEATEVKKPPYYWVDKWGNGYWTPKKQMREAGFGNVSCGPDGTLARLKAQEWYNRWVRFKETGEQQQARSWPEGSIGEGFQRFRAIGEWKRKPKATKDDWWRGWKYIEPLFADRRPGDVTLEELSLWYWGDPDDETIKGILQTAGVREAHRAMKIWRALWQVLAALKYCTRDSDPSHGIRRRTPKARDASWSEGEAVRLVKRAIREKYLGLACIIAIAWDTQFSPVDVRKLAARHRRLSGGRLIFDLTDDGREKTEKSVIGTLSRRTERLVGAYLRHAFGEAELLPETVLFLSRGHQPVSRPGKKGWGGDRGGGRPTAPVPYTKDLLTHDFRAVRAAEFGAKEDRKLSDMRRSGAIEAVAGEVDPGALSGKMGNTIDESRELQQTYLPAQVTIVRIADRARLVGRRRLRED